MSDANVERCYFHTGNSGLSFFVESTEHGPLIGVEASAFGHPFAKSGVYVEPDGLRVLAAFFAEQAEKEYRTPYCMAAETPGKKYPHYVTVRCLPSSAAPIDTPSEVA